MIQYLSWYHDITDEKTIHHTFSRPTMADIIHRLHLLDSEDYPSLTLALDEMGTRFPQLFIYGGPSEYAISLSQGDQDGNCAFAMISYINRDTRDLPASCYRVVGRTYPGCEIEERFFTSDANLIESIIQHFADTGDWKPGVPFTVERDDDDGLHREYTQLLGEPSDYPDP